MENVMNNTSKVFESHIRIQMIASLSIEDLTYKQMKEILGCTDGNMTTHTKKLIQEGFMEVRKEFVNNRPQTTYHLTDGGRTQFEEYVALLNKLVEEGKNAQKVLFLSDFLFFFFFLIVYNHLVIISSEDSQIVHDHINRRKL